MKHLRIYIVLFFTSIAFPCFAGIPDFSYQLSNDKVNVIGQDSDGYIWFGTNSGLNRFTGENFLTWNSSKGGLNSGVIYDFCFTPDGDLWLATECGIERLRGNEVFNPKYAVVNPVHRIIPFNDGQVIASGRNGIIKVRQDDAQRKTSIVATFSIPGLGWAKNIVMDKKEQIWVVVEIEGNTRLFVLDSNLEILKQENLGMGSRVLAINANPDNTVWIALKSGLLCYGVENLEKRAVRKHAKELFSEGNCLFLRTYDENTLLVAHRNEGMHLYSLIDDSVAHIHEDEKLSEEHYSCFVDRDRNIWLSYPEAGYRVFPVERGYTSHYAFMEEIGAETLRNMGSDSKGRIWMSLDNGYAGYDPSGREILWREKTQKVFTHIFVDSKDRIWTISNLNNLNLYKVQGNAPVLTDTRKFDSNILSVCEDGNGNIWIFTNSGIHYIDKDGDIVDMGLIRNEKDNAVSHLFSLTDPRYNQVFVNTFEDGLYVCDAEKGFYPLNMGGLFSVNSVVSASNGSIWLGSLHEGLIHYYPSNGHFHRYDITNGLPGNSIMSVIEDSEGKIWFNTTTHIVCYNPETQSLYSIYDNHFSESNYYSPRCVARTPDGKIYFGGYGGITEVSESTQFDRKSHEIPLKIEYVTVNNSPLPNSVGQVEMAHDQKLLTIMYSGLNMNFGSMVNFGYMMEGVDDDWIATDETRVSYSNLKAGKYVFRVRARLMNGEWSGEELSLPVIVKPSPWLSMPAKITYVITLLFLVIVGLRMYFRHEMREKDLEIKQKHLDFITNISHELRTPLSLIVAPLKQLRKKDGLDAGEAELLDLMERNAARLEAICEDIMDTPTAREKEERLNVGRADISSLVWGISNSFRFAAMEKEQTIVTDVPDGIEGWIDSAKVEKILFNLIGNACKYAGNGCEIRVSLVKADGFVEMKVSDNGVGIPKDRQDRLFGRYNRLGAERMAVKGSGIGLNYSYEIARLHKGELSYAQNDGRGSVFTLSVPCVETAYEASEILNESVTSKYQTSGIGSQSTEYDPARPNILIAEDSEDIRIFMKTLLGAEFNMVMVPDGEAAWDSLKVAMPDLVISDVMMPRKDGVSLCSDIKNHAEYCHIPVIMLTAKTGKDDAIKGLDTGADAYVGKPFDPDILLARIRSLIENRKRIQKKVLSLTSATMKDEEAVKESSLKEAEVEFINKLHNVIDEHMDDELFSVEFMAREVGVSYSKLYAKIKALTGQTPLVFLSTYKMNRAMELLKSGRYTVAEVSDMVGASSPFNFSRDFKKHFGVTPSSVTKS